MKNINVQKVAYFHDVDKINGFKLVVTVEVGNKTLSTPSNYYDLSKLSNLPDSVKLFIIEQLLNFKNDRSICCRKVAKHYNEGLEHACVGRPKSQSYSIQIDALYIINNIVHPDGISYYSCYPVIVDMETKKEINDRPDLIADYYKVYEHLFMEAKKANKTGDDFNFNTKKYAWFGALSDTIK